MTVYACHITLRILRSNHYVMKRNAFYLVVGVISTQLLLILLTLIGCFVTSSEKCDGSRISELMTFMVAQSFALYAAEK